MTSHLDMGALRQECEVLREEIFEMSQRRECSLIEVKQREIDSLRDALKISATAR